MINPLTAENIRDNALAYAAKAGMTTKQAISYAILSIQDEGFSHIEAFDTVIGAGAWDKMVDELYDGLRARAGVA